MLSDDFKFLLNYSIRSIVFIYLMTFAYNIVSNFVAVLVTNLIIKIVLVTKIYKTLDNYLFFHTSALLMCVILALCSIVTIYFFVKICGIFSKIKKMSLKKRIIYITLVCLILAITLKLKYSCTVSHLNDLFDDYLFISAIPILYLFENTVLSFRKNKN